MLPVVDVVLTPSVGLLKIASSLHIAALVLLMFAMQRGVVMAAIALGIATSWWALRRSSVLGFGGRALRRISFHADGTVTLHDRSGQQHAARLLGESLNTQPLLLLRFALIAGGTRSRAIGGGELEADLLRRLRVRVGLFKASHGLD